MLCRYVFPLVAICALVAEPVFAADWDRFRGPNGSGVSPDDKATAVSWTPDDLKWKTDLPGEGVSCPIVVGDRVFVTTYSGYGFEPGEQEDLTRHLVCLDRKTGKILWDKTVAPVLPEDPFRGMGVPQHGYASHTPVSDGERVYVFFGKTGALAFDFDGKQLWQRALGAFSDPKEWGSASSPILVDGVLVVTAGPESRAIIGLDAKTGKDLWQADGESLGNVWGTPAVVKIDDERTDVVIGAPNELWGLDPKTGKLLWYCDAISTDSFNTSVVVDDQTVYAIEGRSGGSIAIKAGGEGDVTEKAVVWKGRDANRFGTPVVYEDRLYFVANGVVNCVNSKTGEKVYQARLPVADEPAGEEPERGPAGDEGRGGDRGGFGGGFGGGGRGGRGGTDYASPVAADGKIYYVNGSGNIYVIKAGDEFESLAINRVTRDQETFAATPAISSGELFFRSNKAIYCVPAP